MAKPPVIIIGMSRSGTSILTHLLEGMGVFMGHKKTKNHEAAFFKELNDWLLCQSSGGLEDPSSIKILLENARALQIITDFTRYALKTPKTFSFLGPAKYFKHFSILNLDIPWGWKDPRNTYTLPFWLNIFPDAKVIHIIRNGVDVASSLKTRFEKGATRVEKRYEKVQSLYWLYLIRRYIPRKRGFFDLRCDTLEKGMELWEEYVDEGRRQTSALGENALEIKYEDMVLNTLPVLARVNDFLSLNADKNRLEDLAKLVNRSGAYGFLQDPELEGFASTLGSRLSSRGYSLADLKHV